MGIGEMAYKTKDSGERVEFESGFQRDTGKGKPRYDLIPPELLKRLAELYARGAEKYDEDNWRKAETEEEIKRFRASGFRHYMSWMMGEEDEDHAAAVVFNIFSYEWHKKNKVKKLPKLWGFEVKNKRLEDGTDMFFASFSEDF